MGFREVSMVQLREILRLWLLGHGYRGVERLTSVHRKTVARYVGAAERSGLRRDGGDEQLTDELLAEIAEAVRPGRPEGVGHGESWELCEANRAFIQEMLDDDVMIIKIARLLERRTGRTVPYRTLHRFCTKELGFKSPEATVRVNDCAPGSELQVDFGRMGIMFDPHTKRRRVLWALIFTAVYSRHMFVWLTFTQSFRDVIAGFEAAWSFFGGAFRVVIPDNIKAIVDKADATDPRINDGFYEYAQDRGFVVDPARVRHPKDKPRVERMVSYVRGSFFKGETFLDRDDAQGRAEVWCLTEAGLRNHGTTRRRPLEVFEAEELPHLLPAPERTYDVPAWSEPKVHKDCHIEVARALYSVPYELIGKRVKARADSALVKVFYQGELIKVHPKKPAGARSTDAADFPEDKRAYATRDLAHLIATATSHGASVGAYVERLLSGELPWTNMRRVYRLLSLVRRHGAGTVDDACAKSLELDVVDVSLIARMLERGAPQSPPRTRAEGNVIDLRFARSPDHFRPQPQEEHDG